MSAEIPMRSESMSMLEQLKKGRYTLIDRQEHDRYAVEIRSVSGRIISLLYLPNGHVLVAKLIPITGEDIGHISNGKLSPPSVVQCGYILLHPLSRAFRTPHQKITNATALWLTGTPLPHHLLRNARCQFKAPHSRRRICIRQEVHTYPGQRRSEDNAPMGQISQCEI